MQNKVCGLLGMSRRAGCLSAGFDAVCADIAAKKAVLVLLAQDASAKTCKELRFSVQKIGCRNLPVCRLSVNKEELAHALGFTNPVGVCCITNDGFAAALQKAGVSPESYEIEEDTRL